MHQEMIDIEKVDLLNKTLDMKNAGYRLSQICATTLTDCLYLLYSFVKEEGLYSLRFTTQGSDPVESISWLYSYAYLYENEMKDLFGLNVVNMNMDFKGHLYDTAIKRPFNPIEEPTPPPTIAPAVEKEVASHE